MSFLKQLLTPFVEFDENKKKEQAGGIKPAPSTPATPSPASPAVPPVDENAQHPLITGTNNPVNVPLQAPQAQPLPTYSPSGTLIGPLPEHEQYFEKLIEEANAKNPLFQGPDYKEFVDSKRDIDDIQDEALKYKTAYNILKNTGLTKEKLLSTGQEYLNLIGRDLNAFQSAHAGKYQKEVRQKEQLIQKKAEELQALTQRVNTLKAEINQLTQDINLTKDTLNTTKNSFLLAGENKQKEIQTELQKIAQYF
jgi:cell division protein FtsB